MVDPDTIQMVEAAWGGPPEEGEHNAAEAPAAAQTERRFWLCHACGKAVIRLTDNPPRCYCGKRMGEPSPGMEHCMQPLADLLMSEEHADCIEAPTAPPALPEGHGVSSGSGLYVDGPPDIHEQSPPARYPALCRLLEHWLRLTAEIGAQSLRRGEVEGLFRRGLALEGLRLPVLLGDVVVGESGGHLTVARATRLDG